MRAQMWNIEMTRHLRSAPITDQEKTQISSVLSKEQYLKLDEVCIKLNTTKSEFIRKLVEDELLRHKDD